MDIKNKLTEKLRKLLNREPTLQEINNSETDYNLVQMVVIDEIEEIKSRLDKIDKN